MREAEKRDYGDPNKTCQIAVKLLSDSACNTLFLKGEKLAPKSPPWPFPSEAGSSTGPADRRVGPSCRAADADFGGLAVAELRRALFEEGRHAFLLVFGGKERMEGPAFEEQALVERAFIGPVDGFLG